LPLRRENTLLSIIAGKQRNASAKSVLTAKKLTIVRNYDKLTTPLPVLMSGINCNTKGKNRNNSPAER
jgi:hypothetical protein